MNVGTREQVSRPSRILWRARFRGGFALVVTVSLMVLLSIIVVGLLSLSAITLRQSRSGADQTEAMANARLALLLALGQLQEQLGPDERVTAAADQLAGADPATSGATAARRRWTGVYDSWPAEAAVRPEPGFRSWLVSGGPERLGDRAAATNDAALGSAPAGRPKDIVIVGVQAGGEERAEVRVPLVGLGSAGAIAWWTGDENIKGRINDLPDNLDGSLAGVRGRRSATPRLAVELAAAGGERPFSGLKGDGDPRIAKLVDWPQTALVAEPRQAATALFHDLSTCSRGMLVNVAAGGFRKDLSLFLEKAGNQVPKDPLFRVGREIGINFEELWVYYNLYKDLKTGRGPAYTTGGRMGGSTSYLEMPATPGAVPNDDYFFFKQPALISIYHVLSMDAQPVAAGQARYRLRLVVDPILTYWNPLDVPVVMPTLAFNSVKYWQLPYDLRLSIGGRTVTVPISRLISPSDRNVITVRAGKTQQLVMRPGEVLMVSQAANTPTTEYTPGRHYVDCTAGFNFGGGMAFTMRDLSNNTIDVTAGETVRYEVLPNTQTAGGPNGGSHTSYFSLTHHEWYVGEDRKDRGDSVGIGNMAIDWGWGNLRLQPGQVRPEGVAATKSGRMLAPGLRQVFSGVAATEARPLPVAQLASGKQPFLAFSFRLKTELEAARPSRYLARYNRNALHNDFYEFTPTELDMVPFEVLSQPLDSWKRLGIDLTQGPAYFGGSYDADAGVTTLITHSVPREPIHSLGALQHALANGFNNRRVTNGYATLNTREPLLPHISHAIGNSMAPSVLAPDKTEGTASGGRPLADHSYLANRALFDDWFFSGIAPQMASTFGAKRRHSQVAREFFEGGSPLPCIHYRANPGGAGSEEVMTRLFRGDKPTPDGHLLAAAYLGVDGMFNVNSTSVEAWRALFGGLRGRPLVAQAADGSENQAAADGAETAVTGLQTPADVRIDAGSLGDFKDPAQWTGYRTLSDEEIDELAEAVVREVRRRGPFLSLADFVNRRVGTDRELARCGALQAALDSGDVSINEEFNRGSRALTVSSTGGRSFAFPEAEAGAAAYGAPGYVKQGDVLTPIAPLLSARSDTFRIRAYGEKVGGGGQVLARAWCEAVVERQPGYVDPTDGLDELPGRLQPVNERFGRKFRMVSFRWLSPEEV